MRELENKNELLDLLEIREFNHTKAFEVLTDSDSRYIRDLKVNFKNIWNTDHLAPKEISLLGLALAVNDKNDLLQAYFTQQAIAHEASKEELGEAVACASLLSANNVLYRFRHFMEKEKYETTPARIKMNIMAKPVLGHEFFELVSLAVSAVNGCERCVKSHESSVLKYGATEERIFDAVRIASVVISMSKIIY